MRFLSVTKASSRSIAGVGWTGWGADGGRVKAISTLAQATARPTQARTRVSPETADHVAYIHTWREPPKRPVGSHARPAPRRPLPTRQGACWGCLHGPGIGHSAPRSARSALHSCRLGQFGFQAFRHPLHPLLQFLQAPHHGAQLLLQVEILAQLQEGLLQRGIQAHCGFDRTAPGDQPSPWA